MGNKEFPGSLRVGLYGRSSQGRKGFRDEGLGTTGVGHKGPWFGVPCVGIGLGFLSERGRGQSSNHLNVRWKWRWLRNLCVTADKGRRLGYY